MKIRSLWAMFALLFIGTIALVPTTSSAAPKNPLKDVAVTGSGADGEFEGIFKIQKFEADATTLYAVGKLNGEVTKSDGSTEKVRGLNIRWPVQAINGVPLSSTAVATGAVSAMQLDCEILDLQLGPLDLTLLGLNIFLDEVNLEITAIPGGGLLGDLLCAVAGLLNPLGALAQIAGLLNQILAVLNRL